MTKSKFHPNQRVRIKQTAFPGSDDPGDEQLRGKIVELSSIIDENTLVDDIPSQGPIYAIAWEAFTDDEEPVFLLEGEIEPA